MSRIRYLKPGFFSDEDLADCSPWARLLFAGLWGIADKNGRLEDRPRRIAAQVFPYDRGVDVEACLLELQEHGSLILRYEVDGERYICIPGWYKHQRPHWREAEGVIPGPCLDEEWSNNEPSLDEEWSNNGPNNAGQAAGNGNGNGNGGIRARAREDNVKDESRTQKAAGQIFDEIFWPSWPTGGVKKIARKRFIEAPAKERQRILTAEKHYAAAAEADVLFMTVRAENFIGGQKSYYEEWANGPPPSSGTWYKHGHKVSKPSIDPSIEVNLQPWQRYCLSWFDDHGWNVIWRKNMDEKEEQELRNAVLEGRLSRVDVIAGKHPCSQ